MRNGCLFLQQIAQDLSALFVAQGVQGDVDPLLAQIPQQLGGVGDGEAYGLQTLHILENFLRDAVGDDFALAMTTRRSA